MQIRQCERVYIIFFTLSRVFMRAFYAGVVTYVMRSVEVELVGDCVAKVYLAVEGVCISTSHAG
jgi:hypothetical protein